MLILRTFLHTSVYSSIQIATVPRSQAPEPSLGPRLSTYEAELEGVAQATPPIAKVSCVCVVYIPLKVGVFLEQMS